jgi:long-chain acyl-CoA synthetase
MESPGSLAHCRTLLSVYKIPADVYLVQEIPRTGAGKIMRFKLRGLLTE